MKTSTNAEIWLPRMMDVILPEGETALLSKKSEVTCRERERDRGEEE